MKTTIARKITTAKVAVKVEAHIIKVTLKNKFK